MRKSGIARVSGSISSRPGARPLSRIPAPKRSISENPRETPKSTMRGSKSSLITPRPRSQSGRQSRTPQRVLQPTNRFSMDNRRNTIGFKTSRDPRQLGEKACQEKIIQEVIKFMLSNGHEWKKSDFPLDSTKFRLGFNVAMNIIDPGYGRPKQTPEEIISLLTSLGYPFSLKKSSFQTLGTKHSMPEILGVLQFMVKITETFKMAEENVIRMIFPSRDTMGFNTDDTSDEQLIFEHMVNCFDAFNAECNDFGKQFDGLSQDFKKKYEVNDNRMRELMEEKAKLQEELKRLQQKPNKLQETVATYEGAQKDDANFRAYVEKLRSSLDRKKKQLDELKKKVEDAKLEKDETKERIKILQKECEVKSIPLDSHNINQRSESLKHEIRVTREYIEEMKKKRWNMEIELTKVREKISKICTEYNAKMLALDLSNEDQDKLRMDFNSSSEDIQKELHALSLLKRDEENSLMRRKEVVTSDLEQLGTTKKTKDKELKQLKAQLTYVREEKEKTERSIENEEKELDEKLSKIKDQFYLLNQEENIDLNTLRLKLNSLKLELEEKHQQKQDLENRWEEKSMGALAKGKSYLKQRREERNEIWKRSQEKIQFEKTRLINETRRLEEKKKELNSKLKELKD